MKKIESETLFGIIAFIVVLALLVGMVFLLNKTINEKEEFESWYNSLSAEEQAEYDAPYTNVYEVVAIDKYHANITNRYGGVRGTYVCYEFYYVDETGNVIAVNDFRDDTAYEDVVIGESNTFTTNSRTNKNTLTITLETLQALSNNNSD